MVTTPVRVASTQKQKRTNHDQEHETKERRGALTRLSLLCILDDHDDGANSSLYDEYAGNTTTTNNKKEWKELRRRQVLVLADRCTTTTTTWQQQQSRWRRKRNSRDDNDICEATNKVIIGVVSGPLPVATVWWKTTTTKNEQRAGGDHGGPVNDQEIEETAVSATSPAIARRCRHCGTLVQAPTRTLAWIVIIVVNILLLLREQSIH
jgi:hypothetical protein